MAISALRIQMVHDDKIDPDGLVGEFLSAHNIYFEKLDITNRKDVVAFELKGNKPLLEIQK